MTDCRPPSSRSRRPARPISSPGCRSTRPSGTTIWRSCASGSRRGWRIERLITELVGRRGCYACAHMVHVNLRLRGAGDGAAPPPERGGGSIPTSRSIVAARLIAPASMTLHNAEKGAVLAFTGRLNAAEVARFWRAVIDTAQRTRDRALTFDLTGLEACDMAGATMLAAAEQAHGAPATLTGGSEQIRALLSRARAAGAPTPPVPGPSGPNHAGYAARRPHRGRRRVRLPRSGQCWRCCACRAGDACSAWPICCVTPIRLACGRLPLVLLLGFLMGLILAFQSAVPMREFGAELFVANLVSVSLTRELGPLLAAVMLAGRTASAFAAEIGTMKVNEEIDALVTMGLDPMTMLVLPRLVAAVHRDAGHDGGAGPRRPAGNGRGDAWLRISAGDHRGAGADLDHHRRPCWRADQGRLFRGGDRSDRLPRRTEDGRRAAGGRGVRHGGRSRRDRRHHRARWRLCSVFQSVGGVMTDSRSSGEGASSSPPPWARAANRPSGTGSRRPTRSSVRKTLPSVSVAARSTAT